MISYSNKAASLVSHLSQKENFTMTKLNWSTGIVIAQKVDVHLMKMNKESRAFGKSITDTRAIHF